MTEQTARTIANVALGAAALGAAYYVARTPPLRRMAVRFAMTALTGAIPAWLAREAQQAWVQSGRREPQVRL
jgi:hypothetical protein